jgi:hypothetical protein
MSRRGLWIGIAVAVVVAAAVAVGVVLGSSDDALRGEVSATLAARSFVTAVNAGDKDGAAAVACANFADQARSAAAAGADPGIDFVLDSVSVQSAVSGTAEVTQRLQVGGSTQRQPYLLHLDRTDARWFVCGRL